MPKAVEHGSVGPKIWVKIFPKGAGSVSLAHVDGFFFVSVNLFFFFYFRVERRAVNLPTKGNRKVPGVGDAVGDAVGSDVCGVPPFLARKCGDASVVGDVAQSPA